MQLAIINSVQQLGLSQCLHEAGCAALALDDAVFGVRHGLNNLDGLAHCIAAMELCCEQLRLIAGSGLVDLHKVEALAQLQNRLRPLQSQRAA